MSQIIDYYTSTLGILKAACLLINALLIALSTYSHFNSHWTLHARLASREEGPPGSRITLQQMENEYEECRYYNRLYTALHMEHESSDDIDDTADHRSSILTSKQQGTCPNPVLELVLISACISIFAMSILATVIICGIIPKLLTRDVVRTLRLIDLSMFALATLFLLIGASLFWYSTFYISAWCALKSEVHYLPPNKMQTQSQPSPPPSPSQTKFVKGGNAKLTLLHDDTLELIPEKLDVPTSKSTYRLLAPTDQLPNVYYLTRVKRDRPSNEDVRQLSNPVDDEATDFGIQKILESQFNELCSMRQMITEKYFAVAVAFISVVLHAVVAWFIYQRWTAAQVDEGSITAYVPDPNNSASTGRKLSAGSQDHSPRNPEETGIHPILVMKDTNQVFYQRIPYSGERNKRASFDSTGVGTSEIELNNNIGNTNEMG